MYRKHWLIILFFLTGIYACKRDLDVIEFFGFHNPSNFPQPSYRFTENPISKEKFELGRKLFYDPILSANNSISCGSCHIQTSAFTHHGHVLSHGIFDRTGTRNSPPIMNLAWSNSFMWDGGVFNLDLQPVVPLTSHVEMNETMENVLSKLGNSTQYPSLFEKAYGTKEINSARLLKLLSQFMVLCVSSNSRYDSVVRKQDGKSFTAIEQEGYILFKQHCSTCHKEPLFTDNSFRNNGLSISNVNDQGRYSVTSVVSDKYRFKVPSLRNLAFTAPYMHDGRFFTLEAVLEHYTSKVVNTPNLDPLLQQNIQPGIVITKADKIKLLSFLKTLNDRNFVTDRRFSEQ